MRSRLTRALLAFGPLSLLATPAAAQDAAALAAGVNAQGLAVQAKAAATTNGAVITGFTPANMAAWNRAKGRVIAGVGDAIVAFVGDSTTNGHGAGDNPTGNFTNAYLRSVPARVAQQLNAMGLPASNDGFMGTGTMDSTSATITKLPLYNPRLTIASSGTANWYVTAIYTLGGYALYNPNGTGAVSLTPSNAFDGYKVCTINSTGNRQMTTDIGGATLATITYSGATAFKCVSVSTGAAPATGTINVKPVAGTGATYLLGIIPTDSTKPRVQVLNLGWEGARTGDYAAASGSATYTPTSSAAYNPPNALATLAPDLAIINLGLNNLNAGTPVATGQADLQTTITAAKAGGGSCVLVIPPPQNPATRDTGGLTTAYNAMVKALASANGCGLIDLYSHFTSYAAASASPTAYADDVHMLPFAYANIADVEARALMGR